jgi:hypothetical protein
MEQGFFFGIRGRCNFSELHLSGLGLLDGNRCPIRRRKKRATCVALFYRKTAAKPLGFAPGVLQTLEEGFQIFV